MNKKVRIFLLTGVIFIAVFMRFWQLGNVPPSPDWDEAALGYNAYSISQTGRDEYGKFLPVVLESFGDYKPALYAYLVIPAIKIFGLNIFAVRLPSVVFGILAIFATYFLVKELFEREDVALLSTFLLSISPWHIQFSRVAFESNIGLSLNIYAVLFFIKGLKRPILLSLATLFSALSLYAYQSEKVFTPLLIFSLVIIYHKKLLVLPKKYLSTAIIVGALICMPLITYMITNTGTFARAQGVSIFGDKNELLGKNVWRVSSDKERKDYVGLLVDNRRIVYGMQIASNYLSHFKFNWLFITGDVSRHHAPRMGLLYLWEFPFILLGIYYLIFGKFDKKTKVALFTWFLLAPIPASITTGVPHAVRTLNFLPTYQVFSALGIIYFYEILKDKRYAYIPIGAIVLLGTFNFEYYLDQYFVQLNYFDSVDWQYGYNELVSKTENVKNNYQKIVVNNDGLMNQSYIFFLYYSKYDPLDYQKAMENYDRTIPNERKFAKYEFRKFEWNLLPNNPNTLYISRVDKFPKDIKPKFVVNYINGEPAMGAVFKK